MTRMLSAVNHKAVCIGFTRHIDYWLLRKYQEDGRYMNIDESFGGGGEGDAKTDANMTKTELANRRGMISRRSQFRSSILTSEFWEQS